MTTLAFDVYGTLIDTYGMVDLLQGAIGEEKALPFAMLWRDKQLEYSFRRSMMNCYEPFSTCTSDALDYCIESFGVSITRDQHSSLLKRYQNLPVYRDAVNCLASISKRSDMHIYALTNGPMKDVERLFENDGISQYFEDIVSVDEIKKYKPDPAVYRHFLDRTGSSAEDSWLISSNAFDLIGASTFGLNSVWIKRTEQQRMDPWGGRPTHTIQSLSQLEALFSGSSD
jgi:2-haloacid dehalogenase